MLTTCAKSRNVIELTDYQTAIVVIRKAGKTAKARMVELKKVMRRIEEGKRAPSPKAVSLVWVKSHIGINSNKKTDKRAKLDTDEEDPTFSVIMKGGLKEAWKKI